MKKQFTIALLAFVLMAGHSMAQDDTRIGGQLIYGTNINTVGLGAIAEFPIAEKMVISPGFSFYFPKSEFYANVTMIELNGNLNYIFAREESLTFYGLGGLNFTNVSVNFKDAFGSGMGYSGSSSALGLNLGAGANFNIGKNFLPFGELKYIIGDWDRLVIAAGVKFNLN